MRLWPFGLVVIRKDKEAVAALIANKLARIGSEMTIYDINLDHRSFVMNDHNQKILGGRLLELIKLAELYLGYLGR